MATVAASPIPIRRRFTVHEYRYMAEVGILHDDERTELIEGEIIEMSPVGIRHAACVRNLNRMLHHVIGDAAIIDVQNPLQLSDVSQPLPDIMVLKPQDYATSLPGPIDVLLIIEVSDATVVDDRNTKHALYAQAGIPQVIQVDLVPDVVLRFTEPDEDGYRHGERFRPGDTIVIALSEGMTITLSVADMIPPASE